MAKEDDKLVADELFRMNSQINDLLILGGQTKTNVAVLNVTVENQGKKIDEVNSKFDKMDEKVDRLGEKVGEMPERWRGEINTAVRGCQKQRDEVTQAVRRAKDRGKTEATSHAQGATPPMALPAVSEQPSRNWFVELLRDSAKPIMTFIILAAMAVGAGIAMQNCSGSNQNVAKTYMERALVPAQKSHQTSRTAP